MPIGTARVGASDFSTAVGTVDKFEKETLTITIADGIME
jgi:hypothetical protein